MNKKTFLITALIGLILVGGVGFGYWTMRMNANVFIGIAIPVKGLDEEVCKKWEKAFEEALADEDLLQVIVEESDYASTLDVSAGEAVADLKGAIRVRYRRSGSLEVGFLCKKKYFDAMGGVAGVVYEIAQKAVASKEPTFKEYLRIVSERASEKSQ